MRFIGSSARIVVAVAMAALAGSALSGQRGGEALRLPDGQPDLQGVWRFSTITPLERPAEFKDKPVSHSAGGSAYQTNRLAALNLDTSACASRPERPLGE
jgi:hypothetical protein